ncbi:hypothetical protein [Pseudomonas sp. zfem003]|uniref:hypothetical protein n=1 Tax=Pseudomonas sp. zfem003 TaxID=3078198 RepID=UPI00292A3B17|nr:hypothetical protein [Pseudomonas sp. zfem003]MDU9397669.1 hypothetical protein [Pseudomonas sp. zfem003]
MQESVNNFFFKILFCFSLFLCWVKVSLSGKGFLPVVSAGGGIDGYTSQVLYVREILEFGGDLFDQPPLIWIHLIRSSLFYYFDFLNYIGGAALVSFGVALFFIPIMRLFVCARFSYFSILLPILMVLISYRAVFVALSVGYVFLYFLCARRTIYLIFSFVFLNLSSASVLIGVLVVCVYAFRFSVWNWRLGVFLVSLLVSFMVSLQDKIVGFVSASAGYQPTVPIEGSGLLGVLTRSTIFTSFYEGDYIRGGIYLVLLFAVLLIVLSSLCVPKLRGYGFLFFASLPVFFLEGLGVVALIVPIFMFVCQVPLSINEGHYLLTRKWYKERYEQHSG